MLADIQFDSAFRGCRQARAHGRHSSRDVRRTCTGFGHRDNPRSPRFTGELTVRFVKPVPVQQRRCAFRDVGLRVARPVGNALLIPRPRPPRRATVLVGPRAAATYITVTLRSFAQSPKPALITFASTHLAASQTPTTGRPMFMPANTTCAPAPPTDLHLSPTSTTRVLDMAVVGRTARCASHLVVVGTPRPLRTAYLPSPIVGLRPPANRGPHVDDPDLGRGAAGAACTNPVRLAEDMAVLDVLSHGPSCRTSRGIGLPGPEEYSMFGPVAR